MTLRDELLPLSRAARAVGKSFAEVRDLVLASGIGVEWGGGRKRKLVRVRLDRLRRVIEGRVARQEVTTRRGPKQAHRLVRC